MVSISSSSFQVASLWLTTIQHVVLGLHTKGPPRKAEAMRSNGKIKQRHVHPMFCVQCHNKALKDQQRSVLVQERQSLTHVKLVILGRLISVKEQ